MKARLEEHVNEVSIVLIPENNQDADNLNQVRLSIAEKESCQFHIYSSLPSGPGSKGVRLQIRD